MLTQFLAFTQSMGVTKALLLVVAFYIGSWILSYVPERIANSDSKIAQFFMTKIL